MNISDKLEAFLAYNKKGDPSHYGFDSEYQQTFANEGQRKAKYIVDDLLAKAEKEKVSLNKFAYLCIGGADGSEPETVLSDTPIDYAVMIEISDSAAEEAKKNPNFLKHVEKHLLYFMEMQR